MEKSDLLSLAREYAAKQDLYELLGVDPKFQEEKDVQRAWRKTSLRYHPDKAGDKFDPEKWQFLERARDVLMDTAAREAYDAARSAALLRDEKRRAMDNKRRAMIDDLEARERGEVSNKKAKTEPEDAAATAERRRMEELGRKKVAERRQAMKEAEEREKKREEEEKNRSEDWYGDRLADLERQMKEAEERKAAKRAAKDAKKSDRKKRKQDAQ